MCRWMLALVLCCCVETVLAADACPQLRGQMASSEAATRVAAAACNEHLLWYRPFIDREGRMASSRVSEAEDSPLEDGVSTPWRQVARYWQESGLLRTAAHRAGASDCSYAYGSHYPSASCRAFVVDTAWSAAFISWVMAKASLPGFRPSASHVNYVRDAYLHPQSSAYLYQDPAQAQPATGDLLCYVRQSGRVYGYQGLRTVLANDNGGLNMHCEIVVATNPDNDGTAYLVSGNVQQSVTMRMLALNRDGGFWGLPQRTGGDPACSPDNEAGCNFNRQDWAVLLKLKLADQLAQLPLTAVLLSGALPASQTPAQQCCIHCVVGSGVPRCPKEDAQ